MPPGRAALPVATGATADDETIAYLRGGRISAAWNDCRLWTLGIMPLRRAVGDDLAQPGAKCARKVRESQ
jgi:hypothetical protein